MRFDPLSMINKTNDSQNSYQNGYARGQQDLIRLILDDLIYLLSNIEDNDVRFIGYKEAINVVKSYK